MNFLAGFRHALLGLVLIACLLDIGGATVLAQDKSNDTKDWLNALDVGGRAITMALLLTVVGIVIVYLFVGRGVREFFACAFCFGFVLFQNPEVLYDPVPELSKRWESLQNMHPDDALMATLFFGILGIFFLIRAMMIAFEKKEVNG